MAFTRPAPKAPEPPKPEPVLDGLEAEKADKKAQAAILEAAHKAKAEALKKAQAQAQEAKDQGF